MAQPLSIESKKLASLLTTRTVNSRLWFIHNKGLEHQILASLARYQEAYGAIIYGFVLMGNHYHLVARFPKRNKAHFMRDFNSMIARLVKRIGKLQGRGSVWARRYAGQVLPDSADIENWFMYTVANPVSSGLVTSIDQYEGYNSFDDATLGIERTYKWIDWSKYLLKRRYDDTVRPEDFAVEHTLKYTRLPGYEKRSDAEYRKALLAKLRAREKDLVEKRRAEGKGFLGPVRLRQQVVGSQPKNTKISKRDSFRPLVLSLNGKSIGKYLDKYFLKKGLHEEASREFIGGNLKVVFPSGTYPPPRLVPA